MTFTIDNRYCVGSSGVTPPDTACAAYGARWIDQGDSAQADVVPDRQGFAYETSKDKGDLIVELIESKLAFLHQGEAYDETLRLDAHPLYAAVRRAGGYVYVDAWLDR